MLTNICFVPLEIRGGRSGDGTCCSLRNLQRIDVCDDNMTKYIHVVSKVRIFVVQRSRRMSKPPSGNGIHPKDSPRASSKDSICCISMYPPLHTSFARSARIKTFRLCHLRHASLRTVYSRLRNGFQPVDPTVSLSFTGPGSLWTLPSCIACKPIYATLSKFASSRGRREKYKDCLYPLNV